MHQQPTTQFHNRAKEVADADRMLTSKEGTGPENVLPYWTGRVACSPMGVQLARASIEHPGRRHLLWFLTSLENEVKEIEEPFHLVCHLA